MAQQAEPQSREGYQFGAFKGVFTPSILTILGVIMYLRFGWVLGNVGLTATLVIVTLSCAITFFTALSLSSLATNMKVGGGGAYYIISRSLGLEAGAAIGVPLFFAQALSIAFYAAGFAEAFVDVFPGYSPRLVATSTLLALTVVTYFSADLALKAQFLIMLTVAASLVSFFAGGPPEAAAVAEAAVPEKQSFWIVFAVFFPAVTGIEAGIAMSGDLKNPARSLPRGTLAAVITGYLVYLVIPIFLSRVVHDENLLLTQTSIMRSVARWGKLVVAGVWAAALSSALGALLGAPRTLQALARDGALPRFLGRGFGKGRDPRVATGVSFAIALGAIWMGDLNFIAPILTMFFLTSYGLLNISAGLEELIGSVSWRPQVRIPAPVCLIGAAACFAAMFMINAGATFAAALVSAMIYYFMKRRSLRVSWGDMRQGLYMLLARYAIQRLSEHKPDERSWVPNILVLSGSPTSRWHLIDLADAMSRDQGCLTVATILPTESWTSEKERSLSESIRAYCEKRGIEALTKILPADDVISGAQALVKAYGFGPIAPNTILLGESERMENYADFGRLIQLVYQTRRNLVLVREGETGPEERRERIDIWWRGTQQNIGLILALAHLLTRSRQWSEAKLNVKTIVDNDAESDEAQQRLEAMLKEQRIEADIEVLRRNTENVFEMIREASGEADLVFIGMRPPGEEVDTEKDFYAYYKWLLRSSDGLPATAIVLAAEDVEFRRLFGLARSERAE